MRNVFGMSLLALLAFFLSCFGSAALAAQQDADNLPAQPDSVTLFPKGGRAHITRTLPVRDGAIRVVLPAGAQKDSVVLDVDGFTVADIIASVMDSVPGEPSSSATLQTELEKVITEQRAAEAELAAIAARLGLWANPTVRFSQPEDVAGMDRLMAENLAKLHVAQAEWNARLETITERREQLESDLAVSGSSRPRPLLLTARVIPADSLSVDQKTAIIHVSYTLASCGWRPVYRLNALPGAVPQDAKLVESAKAAGVKVNGLVHFSFDAEIFQSTGMDWADIPVTLATADTSGRLAPPAVRPWRIQPDVPVQRYQTKGGNFLGDMREDMPRSRQSPKAAPAQEQSTYTTWDIGKRNLSEGQPSRVSVEEDYWLAAFSRVIRPVVDTRAYLMAEAVLPGQRHLARGNATILVEGSTVGKNAEFAQAGDRMTLFLGVDPRVSAVMRLNANQSGRKGIIDRRQTRVWDWSIEVSNAHKQPVEVRIEEPQPQSGDEAITITAKSTPAPQVEEQTYVWNLEIPAGKKQSVSHNITMSAPQDMQVREGR